MILFITLNNDNISQQTTYHWFVIAELFVSDFVTMNQKAKLLSVESAMLLLQLQPSEVSFCSVRSDAVI